MQNYYIIGDPVGHSLSPSIFQALFARYRINDCSYTARTVTADGLESFLSSLRENNVGGFNVTMPLKAQIVPYVDATDDSVVGSINTVAVRDGKLYGYSTDAAGFYTALAQDGFHVSGKRIVFIGAGAVTPPLVHAAVDAGAAYITIVNRTAAHAAAIASFQKTQGGGMDLLPGSLPDCDLLVNTTPLGMEGVDSDFEDLSFLDGLNPAARVSDLIYRPAKTKLLTEAERRGHKIQNGLPMLVWQAFYSFEKYFGTKPGAEDYEAVMQALGPVIQA